MTTEAVVYKGSANGGIVQAKTTFAPPIGKQVLVRITHSGVCYTDELHKHADMVLGHEGVGIVKKIGEAVSQLKVGEIVGWGYIHKTCGVCENCIRGEDQYCRTGGVEMYGMSNFHQGSFGTYAVWNEDFLFKVPDGLAPEHAAPLMCGGATVFEVIEAYNIRPTDRVGVIGLGGLGHMAVQFLANTGADVVVFSSTDSKREEALKLGAKEFHATKGVEQFEGVRKLDHLIVTSNILADWQPFLGIMKPRGTIYPITISPSNLVVPAMSVVTGGIRIQGTVVAGRTVQKRMLEFAARNGIAPLIETFPLTKKGIEEGMQKLRDGKVRYRAVLVA
ncbi:NAD(P)-dependent alcohol dehydrogenase protein [Mycena kentingensis (nom. inval.)]|nr:NAD(P)-dependent alcohol dehydrogenase protein [Mycena kentingensis (nom. inval.)]